MLSYRHSFHAGNFADVIKHVVIIKILGYLIRKEAAFDYYDTHAGAGLYDLPSSQADKLQEYHNGITKLWQGGWPELDSYISILKEYNPDGTLHFYPGSPLMAQHFLRDRDRAWLFELHPTDYELLRKNTASDGRIRVSHEDGYTGLLPLLPPQSRRGLILLDPPYEVKTDYKQVIETAVQAYKKFPTGIYAIWYPVLERKDTDQLHEKLKNTGIKKLHCFELGIAGKSHGRGMHAAGMMVINPPCALFESMQKLLPRLAESMGQTDGAFYRCEVLVSE